MINYEAIYALYPNVVKTLGNKAFDINGNQINYDTEAVNSWVSPEQYKRDRRVEYPSIQDQLDMLYWDKINNTNIWTNTITNIKTNNPKE